MKQWLAAALMAAPLATVAGEATIAPATLARALEQGAQSVLLDVRTAGEFAEGHVPGAINIPVQELEARLSEVPRAGEIVVYCKSGRRAERAADLLKAGGFKRVRELEGSMNAWNAAKLPVQRSGGVAEFGQP